MSIAVALHELAEVMTRHRFAYLMTVSDDGRPHAVAVTPMFDGDTLVADVGNRTRAYALARPTVCLVWPPAEVDGYSLIVDATSLPTPGIGEVRLTPTKAVLHRPAPAGSDVAAGGCGNDCLPIAIDPAQTS